MFHTGFMDSFGRAGIFEAGLAHTDTLDKGPLVTAT